MQGRHDVGLLGVGDDRHRLRGGERAVLQAILQRAAGRRSHVEKAAAGSGPAAAFRALGVAGVAEHAVSHRELGDERGSDGDLHTLDGVHHSQSKLPVDDVPVADYVERGARQEGRSCLPA